MIYKGYGASIKIDTSDGLMYGHVTGIEDVIGFQGETVEEVKKDFYAAIDDYIDHCGELGRKPNKPASGSHSLRMDPTKHAVARAKAKEHGKTFNAYIVELIDRDLETSEQLLNWYN